MSGATAERRAELAANLAAVRDRLTRACAQVDRDPTQLRLVVVTKYFPRTDVDALIDLGVTDLGENRDQEARAKLVDPPVRARVHFIGQFQTNKATSIAGYADVVHSLDRPKAIAALDRAVRANGREVTGLIQVSLDGATGRGGAQPEDVPALADAVAASALRLGGVMAVAPLGADPGSAFARLRTIAAELRASHPEATIVSAGMSGDLESAIAHGATHLRVGTAILGSRQSHE
ncbi:YggS family pyridoxal phosphate-dependent enzyme [Kribbia dieselivorans]|uniref:YggS family pyridoxal phosphate-dependent enzyme n=1 Tax=Kribbia dieselivorans TaxID=331526 RepID=UPI000837EC57|nr:YggS family pyridoxal phosphate-dependent enzyme [Kribbia dieselivorans]